MRETVLPRPKRRGLKKDGFSDHAFLGCKIARKVRPFAQRSDDFSGVPAKLLLCCGHPQTKASGFLAIFT